MSFKIVRNDITKMNTEAIVNTANEEAAVSRVREGDAFITPGSHLPAKYIIHTVSPQFRDRNHVEERKLRSCYKNSLQLAKENGVKSIAFPLIAAGSFGYSNEEALRVAANEINSFLLDNDMDIYLVVVDDKSARPGKELYPDLEEYIDRNYIQEASQKKFRSWSSADLQSASAVYFGQTVKSSKGPFMRQAVRASKESFPQQEYEAKADEEICMDAAPYMDFEEKHHNKLEERIKHLSDTYSQYLMYLIREKHMENAEVYKRAIVDKKIFSKIKNNKNYHPNKLTALCLCVGAMLNLDESRDLLARAGYALSPCDKTDIIFSFFIENEIYDMIELDIQLEEHGLPCIIK